MSYVIKNCPAYKPNMYSDACDVEGNYKCQDCSDCLLKRLAVMVNQAKHGAKAAGHFNFLADKILQNLDIEQRGIDYLKRVHKY